MYHGRVIIQLTTGLKSEKYALNFSFLNLKCFLITTFVLYISVMSKETSIVFETKLLIYSTTRFCTTETTAVGQHKNGGLQIMSRKVLMWRGMMCQKVLGTAAMIKYMEQIDNCETAQKYSVSQGKHLKVENRKLVTVERQCTCTDSKIEWIVSFMQYPFAYKRPKLCPAQGGMYKWYRGTGFVCSHGLLFGRSYHHTLRKC
jgi:hypothetical protein